MTLAIVTGGTRRIGAAIAARLAIDGYDLALHVHANQELEPALAATLKACERRWALFTADLADDGEVAGLVDRVAAEFGRAPALLVNNASRWTESAWSNVSASDLAEHFAINLTAPVILAQRVAHALGADGRGAVINILDQRVTNPPIDQAAYTASKLGLSALTRVLARAFAPNLRVNAVAPGLTLATPDFSERQLDRLREAMPLETLSSPDGIAGAVAYLAAAHEVTGQTIAVDGGASLESWRRDFLHMDRDE